MFVGRGRWGVMVGILALVNHRCKTPWQGSLRSYKTGTTYQAWLLDCIIQRGSRHVYFVLSKSPPPPLPPTPKHHEHKQLEEELDA